MTEYNIAMNGLPGWSERFVWGAIKTNATNVSGQGKIDDKDIHNVRILKMAKTAWMDGITGEMLTYECDLLMEQLKACGNVTEVLLLGTWICVRLCM